MNEKLKFSWGHIVAFLALIFVSYISFIGITYLTNGNFLMSFLGMVIIDVFLLLFFIGGQMMKGTEHKFNRNIVFERIFIFGSPLIFILSMIPFSHFWSVRSHNDEIVREFTEAISLSKQLFNDYEQYSDGRVINYEEMLNRVISNKNIRRNEFANCGFTSGKESFQKENMLKTLRLQLRSENYDSLKNVAIQWIELSNAGASTWNVFLLGNTKEIKSAIGDWQKQLVTFSVKKQANEEFNDYNEAKSFSDVSDSVNKAQTGLDNLKEQYTKLAAPNFVAIVVELLIYFMLLFPYILQDRHTKNVYCLMGKEKEFLNKSKMFNIPQMKKQKNHNNDEIIIGNYTESKIKTSSSSPSMNEDDEYGSFTL